MAPDACPSGAQYEGPLCRKAPGSDPKYKTRGKVTGS